MDKLGLGRKSKKPTIGKESHSVIDTFFNAEALTKTGIIIGFFLFLVVFFPRTTVKEVTYTLGEPWTQDDLTAPFTFSLLKEKEDIEAEKKGITSQTPLIFHTDASASIRIEARMDSLFNQIDPVIDAYIAWRVPKRDSLSKLQLATDSLTFITTRNSSSIGLDQKGWEGFLSPIDPYAFTGAIQKAHQTSRETQQRIRSTLSKLFSELLKSGIINVNKKNIVQNELTIRDLTNRTERNQYLANVKELREAREYANYHISRTFTGKQSEAAIQMYNLCIEPNLVFSERDTERRIQEALANISPTKGAVAKGQVIIRKGDLINRDRLNMLQSLAKARARESGGTSQWSQTIGQVLILLSIISVFLMYIYLYRRPIFDQNKKLFLLVLLFSIIVGLAVFIDSFDNISVYFIPVAITPIILTIIFDSRVGILSTVTLALIIGLMNGYDFEYTTATISACSMAVYSVRDIRNRSQFYLITPTLIWVSYALVYVGFSLSTLSDFTVTWKEHLISISGNALLNLVLVYPLILLVERIFKVTTDVTLLELSDTNRPLLKALMLRAPGTFHHSLQVANLSEAGANVIGANPLLCRVGALYHDIGKMEKPEYFVENQSGMNVHDKLKPRMSALVIKNHVSNGVKMAEEHKLPDILIDFIRTHHGTSLIKYFYTHAKNQTENEFEIQEGDFRYEGPIPHTKETGILMLADSVEAAARSLKDPSYSKIESLLDRIFEDKLDDRQLSNCPLTFKDIMLIKDAFMTVFKGIYHGRVKYPNQEKETTSNTPFETSTNFEDVDYKQENTEKNAPIDSDSTPS